MEPCLYQLICTWLRRIFASRLPLPEQLSKLNKQILMEKAANIKRSTTTPKKNSSPSKTANTAPTTTKRGWMAENTATAFICFFFHFFICFLLFTPLTETTNRITLGAGQGWKTETSGEGTGV